MKRTCTTSLATVLLLTSSVIAQIAGEGSAGDPAQGGGAGSVAGGTDAGTGQSIGPSGPGQNAVFSYVSPWQEALPGGGGAGTADVNAITNPWLPPSLEEALQQAMKSNPEIELAEANRRQAEMAENLTKSKVAQQVVETFKQWQFDKQSLTRTEALHQTASVSEAELLAAKQAVVKSETALQFLMGGYAVQWPDTKAAADGLPGHVPQSNELPESFRKSYYYHRVGGAEGGAPSAGEAGGAGTPGSPVPGTGAEGGGGTPGLGGGMPGGAAAAPESKFDEKLSQASGPVSFDGLPVADFAKLITERAKVPVIVDHHTFEASGGEMNFQINLTLESDTLTWKEVLIAISDTHDVGFIIRDYGILVTTKQKAAAQGFGGGFFGGGLGGASGGGQGFF